MENTMDNEMKTTLYKVCKDYIRTLGKHRDSIGILWRLHAGFYRRNFEKTLHPQGVQSCGQTRNVPQTNVCIVPTPPKTQISRYFRSLAFLHLAK